MKSLADVVRWLEDAPAGSMLPAHSMLALIRDVAPDPAPVAAGADVTAAPATWQERLWSVPADARLSARDVAESIGRPKSWVYRHTSPASGLPLIPHRKLDGELVFLAGEVRQWVRDHEEMIVAASTVTPIHRARRAPLDPLPIARGLTK